MAVIVKRGTVSPVSGNITVLNGPSFVTLNPSTNSYAPPAIAGEPLTPGMACHYGFDGRVYASFGGGATAYAVGPLGLDPTGFTDASLAQVDGYCVEQVFAANEPVTLVTDVVWDYCNVAQTVGQQLFVSATVIGSLDTVASTNGTAWVGKVQAESPAATTSTKVLLKRSGY